MSFDFDAILRQIKPEKHRLQLRPENATGVIRIEQLSDGPVVLVPDTVVYVTLASGRDASTVGKLISRALQYHSAVALSELAQGVAQYDPAASNFTKVRKHYSDLLRAVPASRIITPDAETWLRAGTIAGALSRIQGFDKQQRKELYADALIYLSATKLGLPVLTRNVKDFALISQMHGSGQIIAF